MSKITDIGKHSKNPDKIGNNIVKQAVQQAIAEKMGAKIAKADVVIKIAKGEFVPASLRGEKGLKLDRTNIANSGWEKGWLNLGLWERTYSQTESSMDPDFNIGILKTDLIAQAKIRELLTREELKIVDSLKVFK